MKQETKSEIINDLKKSGFASEIAAIRKIKSGGWDVIPNYAYNDPQDEKTRTIDFLGWKILSHPPDDDLMRNGAQIFLVGEVKKTERPWIVFCEQGEHEQNHDFPILSGYELPKKITSFEYNIEDPLAKTQNYLGYNIHECFKPPSESSRWFNAFITVIKATEAINDWEIEAHSASDEETKPYPEWFLFTLRYFQPLVVIDGDLLQTNIASGQELDVVPIDMISVRVKYESKATKNGLYRVHVVQLSAIEKYLGIMREFHSKLVDSVFEAGGVTNKNLVWRDIYLKQQRDRKKFEKMRGAGKASVIKKNKVSKAKKRSK
jgi:hypothetical protein